MRKPLIGCLTILLWSVAAPALAGSYGVDVSGYLDGEFMAKQVNVGSEVQYKSSFGDNSHVLMWATAQPSDKAGVLAEMWYWQASNTVTLQQAMIDWRLLEKDAGEWSLRFGKFYFPFGIEMQSAYATTNKLVSRPFFTSRTDNGVAFHGQMKEMGGSQVGLTYDVALSNGFAGVGLSPQRTDVNNNKKSVGGRITVSPTDKVDVGGSLAWGKWDTAGESSYLLLGGHAIVGLVENLDFRGEFVSAMFTDGLTAGTDLTKLWTYGQVAYRLHPASMEYAELAARFGWMDPNTDASDDATMQVAVGGTISPAEHLMIKGEFQYNRDQTPSGTDDPDDNELRFQAIFGW
jgi:hypothetical protein